MNIVNFYEFIDKKSKVVIYENYDFVLDRDFVRRRQNWLDDRKIDYVVSTIYNSDDKLNQVEWYFTNNDDAFQFKLIWTGS